MGIPCGDDDDVVLIRQPDSAGDPTVVTVNCPDKTGLGCDLTRIILSFGLTIVRGDVNTDGKWCYILFWVVGRGGRPVTRWSLLKKRLLGACPAVSFVSGLYKYFYGQQEMLLMEQRPQVFLLKFCCCDRMALLHVY